MIAGRTKVNSEQKQLEFQRQVRKSICQRWQLSCQHGYSQAYIKAPSSLESQARPSTRPAWRDPWTQASQGTPRGCQQGCCSLLCSSKPALPSKLIQKQQILTAHNETPQSRALLPGRNYLRSSRMMNKNCISKAELDHYFERLRVWSIYCIRSWVKHYACHIPFESPKDCMSS